MNGLHLGGFESSHDAEKQFTMDLAEAAESYASTRVDGYVNPARLAPAVSFATVPTRHNIDAAELKL